MKVPYIVSTFIETELYFINQYSLKENIFFLKEKQNDFP